MELYLGHINNVFSVFFPVPDSEQCEIFCTISVPVPVSVSVPERDSVNTPKVMEMGLSNVGNNISKLALCSDLKIENAPAIQSPQDNLFHCPWFVTLMDDGLV